MVKKESVVVKQQPKSVRSPSLPPMTLPLNLTATTSNPTNGSSAVIGLDFVFHFFSQSSQIFSYESNGHKNDWSGKAEQFTKLSSLNDEIDENTNFVKLSSAKRLLYTGYLQLPSFWLLEPKASSHFYVKI